MIRASDLLGCSVRTESGAKLGRVHDLRVERDGEDWRLAGLMVGRQGMLARLTGGKGETTHAGTIIPWESITSLQDGIVTVRNDPGSVLASLEARGTLGRR
jgi:sporulation protein YlmC with PRC-barrel domain